MFTFVTFLLICFYIAHLQRLSKNTLFYAIILSSWVSVDFSENEEISLIIFDTISSKLFISFFSVLTYRSKLLDLSWRTVFILLLVYPSHFLYPAILLRSSQGERSIFSKNSVVIFYPKIHFENYSAFLFIYEFSYFLRLARESIWSFVKIFRFTFLLTDTMLVKLFFSTLNKSWRSWAYSKLFLSFWPKFLSIFKAKLSRLLSIKN